MPAPKLHLAEQEESLCLRAAARSPFPGCFPAGQPTACAGAWHLPPQVQDVALPLELLGVPTLAGYDPRLMQRAAPSHDSTQEEGFGYHCSVAAPSSAGW